MPIRRDFWITVDRMKRRFLSRMSRMLWGEGTAPRYGVESPYVEEGFDSDEPLDESQSASIRNLIELLAERLGAERASAMALRASQVFEPGDDCTMAFADATSVRAEHRLSIYADWNAASEVEWQVNKIFETLELPARWHWASAGDASMVGVFKALEEWLSLHGYHLWHVVTGGDDALAFPVRINDAALAERLARGAGMVVFALEDAKRYYGSAAD